MLHLALLLLISAPHSDSLEESYYARLKVQQARIYMLWHPGHQMIRDEAKAYRCYVSYHLGKVGSCDAELALVDTELKAARPDLKIPKE